MAKKKPQQEPFGQVLREKRIEKGYSLRKFAQMVGVSPAYLSQVEQMNVDPPTAGRVKSSGWPKSLARTWTNGRRWPAV